MPVSASLIAFLQLKKARPSARPHWLMQGVPALLGFGTLFCGTSASLADIVSDSSAGSIVTNPNCLGAFGCTIFGGQQQGNHLFHSFSEFIIPPTGNALLIPPANNTVEKIFIRVVDSATEIHGRFRIGNQGFPTDTIFLSPQGITISESAQISYPGTFLFSTAGQLDFAGGAIFDAIDNVIPLLSISGLDNVPQALQLGNSPGVINLDSPIGFDNIQIPQIQNQFSIIGGAVNFRNVEIFTPGTIHIGAVDNNQAVGLDFSGSGIDFDYGAVSSFEDITLDNSSLFTRSSSALNDAGSIEVVGNSLTLSNAGKIVSGFNNFNAGSIDINLENTLMLSESSEIATVSNAGDTGNLNITAGNLNLRDQSFILSRSDQVGGNLNINLSGDAALNTASYILLELTDTSAGSAGELGITGQNLNLDDNSRILHRTSDGGGNIILDFENDVLLSDRSQLGAFLTSNGRDNLQGDAGNIEIEAQSLTLSNASEILTETGGTQGNIIIDLSGDLSIAGDASNRSQIISQLAAETGAAGTISIAANDVSFESGLLFSATDQPGGSISINAANTIQLNQSEIRLSSKTGAGHTGNLNLTAQSTITPIGISIINTEILNEATDTGGDITFSTLGEVVLQEGSFVSIDSSGTGGNLTVTASAFRSNTIDADNDVLLNQGTLNNLSLPADVTGFDTLANQMLRANGNSELLPNPLLTRKTASTPTSPETNDNRPPTDSAFKSLPSQRENAPALDRLLQFYGPASSANRAKPQSCSSVGASYWKISGRGGVRSTPSSLNGSSTPLADLGELDEKIRASSSITNSPRLVAQPPTPSQSLHEARVWHRNQQGHVELVAQSNMALAQSKTHRCQSLR